MNSQSPLSARRPQERVTLQPPPILPVRVALLGPQTAELPSLLEPAGYQMVSLPGEDNGALERASEPAPDLAIAFLDPDSPGSDKDQQLLSDLYRSGAAILIAVDESADCDRLHHALDFPIYGCLVRPYRKLQILSTLAIAVEQHRRTTRLEQDLRAEQERLETRKLVDRAKAVLMRTHEITEADAFRQIQVQSMNSRRSMKDIAQEILGQTT